MTNTIINRFYELQDKQYAAFQAKLTPNIAPDRFIGVRIPALRKLAKQFYSEQNFTGFIHTLPHHYYEENMLHALILSEYKDYDECIKAIDLFLPYVDNWAVCDSMSPKVFQKHKTKLLGKIDEWMKSNAIFTCRFGIGMLMRHYLDDAFEPQYLEYPASIRSDEYYINMMIAWFYATALAKQWDSTLPYLEEKKMEKWVHNKTIQKAVESYRITDEQKTYLKTLKR